MRKSVKERFFLLKKQPPGSALEKKVFFLAAVGIFIEFFVLEEQLKMPEQRLFVTRP